MKFITLMTVIAVLADAIFIPKPTVGPPLTGGMILFVAMLAVAIYEAWSKKRGGLGWFVNIFAAITGGFFVAGLFSITLSLSQLRAAVALYPNLFIVSTTTTAILAVLGSWTALQAVNQFRDKRPSRP